MSTIEVLIPRPARIRQDDGPPAAAPFTVQGRRVAIVNNGWGSFDDLSLVLERMLRDEYGVADVVQVVNDRHTEDDRSTFGGTADMLDEIAERADVAISGLGNCGACTAWSCDTGAGLERRGLDTATLVTGRFGKLARFNFVHTNQLPDHRLVVFEDDFEYTEPAALEAAARSTLVELYGAPVGRVAEVAS